VLIDVSRERSMLSASYNSKPTEEVFTETGWLTLAPQLWQDGDRVTVTYNLAGKLVPGTHGNSGKAALVWGPIVLAYDEALNPGLPHASLLGLVVEPVTIARVVFGHDGAVPRRSPRRSALQPAAERTGPSRGPARPGKTSLRRQSEPGLFLVRGAAGVLR
jgi:DUF1680 family protein